MLPHDEIWGAPGGPFRRLSLPEAGGGSRLTIRLQPPVGGEVAWRGEKLVFPRSWLVVREWDLLSVFVECLKWISQAR